MNGRRSSVGLGVLCALLLSAFAAQNASAFPSTTAFTCSQGAGGQFTDAHCKSAGSGSFRHESIPENTTTELTATNGTTGEGVEPLVLKSTVGGVTFEIKATGVIGEGTMENRVGIGKEHYAHGTTSILGQPEYTGVTLVKPAGLGCKITADPISGSGVEGLVLGNTTTATTEGQGDAVRFTTPAGQPLATFMIEGCVFKGTYQVTGSLIGTPEGATVKFTHESTTSQNTLKLGTGGGNKAGISGSITFKGNGVPLSPTTVETPS